MKKLLQITLVALAAAMTLTSCAKEPAGLKDAYKKYFMIGVAVNPRNVSVPEQMELVKANFNSMTCENVMKPGEIHPAEGVWKFEEADKVADFCRENGIKLRGHCLVWHSQFANWMFYDSEQNPVSKEVFYERLKEHITTVVNRYKDVIYAWDVVNEAMSDDPDAEDPYRPSRLYQLCGDEFIAKAFQFAHEADPNAILFYNDYNECDPAKSDKIYNMVKKMQDAGVPITGIGMQGHYNAYEPSEDQINAAIEKYSKIVSHIHVTELDVRVNREMGGRLRFSTEGEEISPEVEQRFNDQYAMIFRAFRNHKDVIDCVTFWNLADADSWLGARNYPLLFDKDFQPKAAYSIVKDFKKNKE